MLQQMLKMTVTCERNDKNAWNAAKRSIVYKRNFKQAPDGHQILECSTSKCTKIHETDPKECMKHPMCSKVSELHQNRCDPT